ncbi:MAG TPA: sigma-54 dependent transcriptional regulator [Candidatus Angelobacter sp.]|nr:sigma-54 dependent transcriptional regulator [Candidatus Angelobacter sp.]
MEVQVAARTEKILIVDDEPVVRESLGKWFTEEGFTVRTVGSAHEALNAFQPHTWDVALLDIKMPGIDGIELQNRLHEADPDLIVIMMTGYASVETAIQALKQGAYDYICKPFEPDELVHTINNALEHRRAKKEVAQLREHLQDAFPGVQIIGESPAMKKVYEMIEMVAPTDATVLITGESGTGKEVVARAIHDASPRRLMPFMAIHCGALTETLLESELFGHERGAFTGAQARRKGKFEAAEGGTVFLDEIGDISLKTQTDLLRVLQDKEIVRIGSTAPFKVDFRCIAATNRDLEAMVKEGTFRFDLFYRLNVVSLHLPPLRDRREDIPLLAESFLRKHAIAMNKSVARISPEAMTLLMNYDWPGNVRELENAVERALVIGKGPEIVPPDFPMQLTAPHSPSGRRLEDVARVHIERVLEETGWNLTRAAEILAIDRSTLYSKIKSYGLKRHSTASG